MFRFLVLLVFSSGGLPYIDVRKSKICTESAPAIWRQVPICNMLHLALFCKASGHCECLINGLCDAVFHWIYSSSDSYRFMSVAVAPCHRGTLRLTKWSLFSSKGTLFFGDALVSNLAMGSSFVAKGVGRHCAQSRTRTDCSR